MKQQLSTLLRGTPDDLRQWIHNPGKKDLRFCLIVILVACGLYGLTVGIWRAPLMGAYVALKMPALILLTLAGNGFLNGMLGLLLGSGLGFRQSIMAQLMSFTIAALVLGALSPVTFFMALNAPASDAPNAASAHAHFLAAHTILIAMAGIFANLHLARLLVAVTPDSRTATSTLLAWLAGNAFLGAQLSWIMRPFFGTPSMDVAFLRSDPFNGTFYEAVWNSFQRITGDHGFLIVIILGLGMLALYRPVAKILKKAETPNG